MDFIEHIDTDINMGILPNIDIDKIFNQLDLAYQTRLGTRGLLLLWTNFLLLENIRCDGGCRLDLLEECLFN